MLRLPTSPRLVLRPSPPPLHTSLTPLNYPNTLYALSYSLYRIGMLNINIFMNLFSWN